MTKGGSMRKVNRYVKWLRKYRVIHRYLGIGLSILLFISAITGLLLGWKKNIDVLQPPTQKGVAKSLSKWLPIDQLATAAKDTFLLFHPDFPNIEIERIDVRPNKGIAKVLFDQGNWELQIDGASGRTLSIAKRHSDWIEALHDGSIISDFFKLISMNVLGLGLLVLLLSGIWLYVGPSWVRSMRRK